MNIKDLVKDRTKSLEDLTQLIIQNENGKEFIGNGKEIVHHDAVPLKHSFADNVYIREMKMAKGILVLGAIHKHHHVWFLLTGHLTIGTNETVEDYIAPCYVVSKPGTQRAIYANEDSIFVNIHKNPTNTRDIMKLEKEIVSLNTKEYEEYINQQNLKL
jgi:quercetin dioxygenase-like cupin family protein